jgi:hypothetical protein
MKRKEVITLFLFWMLFLNANIISADESVPPQIDGIYQIKTADELLWFAEQVSIKGNQYIKCLLLNDIDMEGREWIPIGNTPEKNSFWGHFDGGGHTIKGLHINSFLKGNWQYAGMFNSATHCTIQNLTVKGNINCNASGFSCMAGIIARAWDAKVSNVHSFLEISVTGGFLGVGGVAGYAHDASSFDDCSFHGVITCNTSDFYGGIIGNSAESYINNCANYGDFILTNKNSRCGGILGQADNTCIVVSNSLSIGSFEGQGNPQAMIGHVQSMSFSKSKNNYFLSENASKASDNSLFKASSATVEELASGKVTYELNQGQVNIHWYQTLGMDQFPMMDSSHAVVQKLNGSYFNPNGKEACEALLSQELSYCDTVIAQQSIIDVYKKALTYGSNYDNPTDFFDLYNSLLELRNLLKHSEETYSFYCSSINKYRQYLSMFTSEKGEMFQKMERYIDSYVEPCQDFPNGSSMYIIQHHLLGESALNKELIWVENLWYVIQNPKYEHRHDVTHLLINADFSNNFYGWQNVGCSYHWSETKEMVSVNEISDSLNVYQVLTGLPNGIYEFRMKGFYGNHTVDPSTHVNHAAVLYANNTINYFQTEDEIAEGGTENAILTHVTNGVLFVGIKVPHRKFSSGHLFFADAHLYYYGSLENADATLQDVMENQVTQANSVLDAIYPDMNGNYSDLPNFSQSLKDALRHAIEKASSAISNQDKFQTIQDISSIFVRILECKNAYLELIEQFTELRRRVENDMQGLLTEEQLIEFNDIMQIVEKGYKEGFYSAEEAQNYQGLKTLSFLTDVESKEPKLLNGYYQIEEAGHLLWFAQAVNAGNGGLNAQLVNDINIIGILSWNPIGVSPEKNSYSGVFDGQKHTISGFLFSKELGNWGLGGLFGSITHGTVRNLTIKGKMVCQGGACSMFGAIARAWDTTLLNIHVEMDIDTKSTGYYGVGGVTGYAHDNTIIQDCSFSGNIQCNSTDPYGCIIGRCAVSASINNCANYGQLYNNMNGNYIGGVVGMADDASFSMSHCLNIGDMHGKTPALIGYLGAFDKAKSIYNYWCESCASTPVGSSNPMNNIYAVRVSELRSGKITYEMNASQDKVHWYQTLGTDPYPLLDSSHGEVVKEGFDYINTGIIHPFISETKQSNAVYDMNGRIVKKPLNGIYIINGKKIIIRQ